MLCEGINVYPEILIPQLFTEREIDFIRPVITLTADKVFHDTGKYSFIYVCM